MQRLENELTKIKCLFRKSSKFINCYNQQIVLNLIHTYLLSLQNWHIFVSTLVCNLVWCLVVHCTALMLIYHAHNSALLHKSSLLQTIKISIPINAFFTRINPWKFGKKITIDIEVIQRSWNHVLCILYRSSDFLW